MRFELEPYWDNIRPYPAYYLFYSKEFLDKCEVHYD